MNGTRRYAANPTEVVLALWHPIIASCGYENVRQTSMSRSWDMLSQKLSRMCEKEIYSGWDLYTVYKYINININIDIND